MKVVAAELGTLKSDKTTKFTCPVCESFGRQGDFVEKSFLKSDNPSTNIILEKEAF